jgi:hypothetical protein
MDLLSTFIDFNDFVLQFGDGHEHVFCFQIILLTSISYNLCPFLYGVCVFTKYIKIISLDQTPICSIQFHLLFVFLELPDGIS